MTTSVLSEYSPKSSSEISAIEVPRHEEVVYRHQLLAEFLRHKQYDALLLKSPANFSWLTAGGDNTCRSGRSPVAAILVTPEARVILSNNVDSPHLFAKEVSELGFQLKETCLDRRPVPFANGCLSWSTHWVR